MVSGTGTKTRSTDPKIQKIQEEVDATKRIMEQNIDKMLERGEKLEALKDKTEELKIASQAFNHNAVKLKQELQFKNVALTIILIGMGIGAAIGLYGVLAAGYAWFCLPLSAALGGGISYLLTKPLSGMFHLYQKLHYTDPFKVMPSRHPERDQKNDMIELHRPKPFQPQFQGLKDSVEKVVKDNQVEESRAVLAPKLV